MKSNYKQLGEIIRWCDERNRNIETSEVLGVSIGKEYMPSVANIIGTDLSNYKLVRKNRFACNPMHVGRDKVLPVALYTKEVLAIVSPAYFTFEIINKETVLPEYLMLLFCTPIFDKKCWFRTDGTVRGGISWDDLCRVELPVPDIIEQKEIVKNYSQIRKRLELLTEYDDTLKKLGISIVSSETEGTSIIVDEVEAANAIEAQRGQTIKQFCCKVTSGATPLRSNSDFWEKGTIPWLKSGEVENGICNEAAEHITELGLAKSSVHLLPEDSVLLAMYGGGTVGEIGYLASPSTTNQAVCGMICKTVDESAYLFFSLLQSQDSIRRQAHGGAQENLSKDFIESLVLVTPKLRDISVLKLSRLIKQLKVNAKERQLLSKLSRNIVGRIHQHA